MLYPLSYEGGAGAIGGETRRRTAQDREVGPPRSSIGAACRRRACASGITAAA